MTNQVWKRWLRALLYLGLVISFVPVLMSAIAPALVMDIIVTDPSRWHLLFTKVAWIPIGWLTSHILFAVGMGVLVYQLIMRRMPPSVGLKKTASAGVFSMFLFTAFMGLTSPADGYFILCCTGVSMALSITTLWLSRGRGEFEGVLFRK